MSHWGMPTFKGQAEEEESLWETKTLARIGTPIV